MEIIKCRDCGETRIRSLAEHRKSVGHARPFDFTRPTYRAALDAAMAARTVSPLSRTTFTPPGG